MSLYKKCTAKLYYFLVNDAVLAFNNPLRFRCYVFRKNLKSSHDN